MSARCPPYSIRAPSAHQHSVHISFPAHGWEDWGRKLCLFPHHYCSPMGSLPLPFPLSTDCSAPSCQQRLHRVWGSRCRPQSQSSPNVTSRQQHHEMTTVLASPLNPLNLEYDRWNNRGLCLCPHHRRMAQCWTDLITSLLVEPLSASLPLHPHTIGGSTAQGTSTNPNWEQTGVFLSVCFLYPTVLSKVNLLP